MTGYKRERLSRLQSKADAQRDAAAKLGRDNEALRMRLAAIRLAWAVLDEAAPRGAASGAGAPASGGAAAPAGSEDELRLGAIEALGYGFGGLGGGAAALPTAPAPGMRGTRGTSASPRLSSQSACTRLSAGSAGCGCGCGGGGGGGFGGGDGGGGGALPPPACLLAGLPHLAPGASLLHLEGLTPEAAASARGAPPAVLHAIWQPLIEEAGAAADALAAARRGAARTAAAARLRGAGVRMKQLHNLLVLWCFDSWAESCTQHMESRAPTCGEHDAPLAHWERAVRALRLTRGQAMLIVEGHRLLEARLEDLEAERADLISRLPLSRAGAAAAATAADASRTGAARGAAVTAARCLGPFTAALLGGAPWRPPRGQAELVAALCANLRAMRAALALSALLSCAVMTPEQWAQFMALAHPWPPHAARCVSVLTHDLRFRPEVFANPAA